STAVTPMADDDIKALVRASRRNNRQRGLTGLLLAQDDRFVQVLEGPPAVVRALLDTLRTDPRHRNLEILSETVIAERQFGRWAMEGRILGASSSDLDDRVRHILRASSANGAAALGLLKEFREIEQRAMESP
ncbi:MAG: BLUF domain-containing protein, partial [Pseudomonadota bacterium]